MWSLKERQSPGHPALKNIILQTGSCDILKQQSEVQDFIDLLDHCRLCLRWGVYQWPSSTCQQERFSFLSKILSIISSFFWKCRNLFKAEGVCLNNRGKTVNTSNLFYFLRHPAAPSTHNLAIETFREGCAHLGRAKRRNLQPHLQRQTLIPNFLHFKLPCWNVLYKYIYFKPSLPFLSFQFNLPCKSLSAHTIFIEWLVTSMGT